MGKLSPEEEASLKALTDKANAKDDEDDFEVEWWEEDADGKRRGGRLPWTKGKSIYGSHFPELFGDKPKDDKTDDKTKTKDDDDKSQRTSTKYFSR